MSLPFAPRESSVFVPTSPYEARAPRVDGEAEANIAAEADLRSRAVMASMTAPTGGASRDIFSWRSPAFSPGFGGFAATPVGAPVVGFNPYAPYAPIGRGSHPVAVQGTTIVDEHCAKQTWHCHWFPMRATRPYNPNTRPGQPGYDELKTGGDTQNNLYAKGGALDKYDQAFIQSGPESARTHEILASGHYVPAGDTDKGWWGHCNNASEVACLLEAPKHNVEINGVTFTPHDIAGLLCRISESLSAQTDFCGQRYNGPMDDANDPNPAQFLATMKQWSKEGLPFVLDITRTEQVWNYPYDSVRITEYNGVPVIDGIKADSREVPAGGTVKYYRFELSGTDFPAQARDYMGFIHTSDTGEVTARWVQWRGARDAEINCDFAWRPHRKFAEGEAWRGTASGNPNIDAEKVQILYEASLA